MWVCEKHQVGNQEAMEKFKRKYKTDFNLNLGLVVNGSVMDPCTATTSLILIPGHYCCSSLFLSHCGIPLPLQHLKGFLQSAAGLEPN